MTFQRANPPYFRSFLQTFCLWCSCTKGHQRRQTEGRGRGASVPRWDGGKLSWLREGREEGTGIKNLGNSPRIRERRGEEGSASSAPLSALPTKQIPHPHHGDRRTDALGGFCNFYLEQRKKSDNNLNEGEARSSLQSRTCYLLWREWILWICCASCDASSLVIPPTVPASTRSAYLLSPCQYIDCLSLLSSSSSSALQECIRSRAERGIRRMLHLWICTVQRNSHEVLCRIPPLHRGTQLPACLLWLSSPPPLYVVAVNASRNHPELFSSPNLTRFSFEVCSTSSHFSQYSMRGFLRSVCLDGRTIYRGPPPPLDPSSSSDGGTDVVQCTGRRRIRPPPSPHLCPSYSDDGKENGRRERSPLPPPPLLLLPFCPNVHCIRTTKTTKRRRTRRILRLRVVRESPT